VILGTLDLGALRSREVRDLDAQVSKFAHDVDEVGRGSSWPTGALTAAGVRSAHRRRVGLQG
jgi:hypothetical protein